MRLFIGIELPEEIKDYLYNFVRKFNTSNLKVNWVHKKNLHLTLKFIGEVEDDKVNDIIERLGNIRFNKFTLNLDKLGFFSSKNFIKIIWVSMHPVDTLIKLQKIVDQSLLDLFSSDQRFEAHLTLGRVKSIKNREEFIKKIENTEIDKKSFEVTEFKLVKSTLTSTGPIYEDVRNFYCNSSS